RKLDLSKTLVQQEVGWKVTRNFWIMLRSNTGSRVLRLDESLSEFMDIVTEEYFFETLAFLPKLVVLENDFIMVGIEVVLDSILTLKRYVKLSDPIATLSLLHAQTALQLTQVALKARLTCWEFFNFLRNAPNLDYLRILELAHVNSQQPCSQEEAALLMDNTPSRLTSIQLEIMIHERRGRGLAGHYSPMDPKPPRRPLDTNLPQDRHHIVSAGKCADNNRRRQHRAHHLDHSGAMAPRPTSWISRDYD
ncbi:hypothetical protein BGX24_004303, partial [Mortierella sp. AD032]